jgi:hypothetical protein
MLGIFMNGVTAFGVCAAWNNDTMAFSMAPEQYGISKKWTMKGAYFERL